MAAPGSSGSGHSCRARTDEAGSVEEVGHEAMLSMNSGTTRRASFSTSPSLRSFERMTPTVEAVGEYPAWRLSRSPWNFGGGPVIIRRPGRLHHGGWRLRVE